MNSRQKLIYAVGGFFIGNIILTALIYGFAFFADRPADLTNDEALRQIRSKEIKNVVVKNDKKVFAENETPQLMPEPVAEAKFEVTQTSKSLAFAPDNIISNPLRYLFQILFWLILLSPPLTVLLLFLIWRELRARNEKMK